MTTRATPAGLVRGLALEGADAFLGLPYAEPPVGPLRFAAPVPAAPWEGVRDATAFGPSAPQPVGGPFSGLVPGMGVGDQDEDCLTLNVWSPHDGDDLPVMVWIHGGAFTLGGSSLPTYDGRLLAVEQRVVVVSVNYRLGALGWLTGLPGVTSNCGLRDQLLALAWVRDHIGAFGGDPGNVTVFGESAGAGSVLHLLASPAAEGLLHKAIAQSPGAGQTLTPELATAVADALQTEFAGVDLMTVPTSDLLAAQQRVADALLPTVGAMAFHPAVDSDVVPAAPLSGGLLPVPLLAGTTSEEMRLFAHPALARVDLPTVAQALVGLLSAEARRPLDPVTVHQVVSDYAAVLVPPGDHADLFAAVATDQVMRLPLERLLDRHEGPVHAYTFTWQATGAPRAVGACHAVDLPFTFGSFDVAGWDAFVGDVEQARELSACLRAAWAAFARTGTPAAPGLPAWPLYETGHRRTLALGRTVEVLTDPLAAARSRCAPFLAPDPLEVLL